jgi:hypothetical protein
MVDFGWRDRVRMIPRDDAKRYAGVAIAAAAWGTLAAVALATLVPLGLRPHVTDPNLEYLGAYAFLGFLFGLSHPRRLPWVIIGILGGVVALEIAQGLTADRHPRIIDALVKSVGGGIGVMLSVWVRSLASHFKRPSRNDVRTVSQWEEVGTLRSRRASTSPVERGSPARRAFAIEQASRRCRDREEPEPAVIRSEPSPTPATVALMVTGVSNVQTAGLLARGEDSSVAHSASRLCRPGKPM